jgi:acetyl-CoA C-acetyltransferase
VAAQALKAGDARSVIAGGQENMSASPHVIRLARRLPHGRLQAAVDSMIVDGLWDVYNQYHMGTTAEERRQEIRDRAPSRTNSRRSRS